MNESQLLRKAIHKAFPGISGSETVKLIQSGNVAEYPPNQMLCLEGRVEDIFYVILAGEVLVTKEINSIDNRLLKQLNPGDFFGEMGLIHDAPRAATVTTISNVTVLEIDKEAFKEVLQESSMVSLAMVREVSRRLRENDEMAIEDLRFKAGELAEAYQQLAELDLARREFLTTIAHELRTPLTSANGYLQMIRISAIEGEDLKNSLNVVADNLQRIIGLMNDILFLQEMDLIFSDFETIDLVNLVTKIIQKEIGAADEVGVKFSIVNEGPGSEIYGDLKSLDRTFSALINNAVKFSISGGLIEIQFAEADGMVWVIISDPGIGIEELNIPHIFERFWRTEEFEGHLFGGIGLGLSIAKQVIEQHKGLILVESIVGVGSIFKVGLPKHVRG